MENTDFTITETIMIVDDKPANVDILVKILNLKGYKTRAFTNSKFALESAKSNHPTLILLDIRMPDLDGIMFCEELKKDKETSKIPVIFISALLETEEKVNAFNAGGVDYITKPFQEAEVLSRIKTHLSLFHINENLEMLVEKRTEDLKKEIVERKKIEKSLRQSFETNQALLNAPTDSAIFLINQEGVIYSLNDTASDRFGKNKDELLNKNIYQLLDPELAKVQFNHQVEVNKTGNPVRFVDKANKKILDNNVYPILNESGEIEKFAIFSRDVTKQHELEKNLIQAQKIESIGNLAGGIAHDFNNILTIIFGYSEFAISNISKPDKLKLCIQEVVTGAGRARDLVRQILTFSRKYEQEKHYLQISLVVREALKMLRSIIPSTIEMDQNIESDSIVYADSIQIHQIVMNLCTNAYQAMIDTGGTLTVILKEVKYKNSSTVIKSDDFLMLEVSDTGYGMDEDTISNIFEPYFTTKEIGEGTGLGMAVVHGIVQDHNGYIEVESEPGKGTTFQVYLPVSNNKTDLPLTETEDKKAKGGGESILFVDDEIKIVSIAEEVLSSYGYKVKTFVDGVEAYKEFCDAPDNFDIIITDMTMPSLTGLKLAKKIFKIKPDIPVILCTGHSDLISKKEALSAGIKGYYEKPIRMGELIRTIRTTLDKGNL